MLKGLRARRDGVKRMDLIDLYDRYRADPRFDDLRGPGIRLVPGRGNERPLAMIVGEAPGALDNTIAAPFRGASGRVLESLMELAKLDEGNSFVTNVVKYRPPGGRTPFASEILASREYLREEWRILGKPRVVVAIGAVAWFSLLKKGTLSHDRLSEVIGTPIPEKDGVTLWPMYHPASGLADPDIRPVMEDHWESLGRWLKREHLVKED